MASTKPGDPIIPNGIGIKLRDLKVKGLVRLKPKGDEKAVVFAGDLPRKRLTGEDRKKKDELIEAGK